jgi:hypothetical protein
MRADMRKATLIPTLLMVLASCGDDPDTGANEVAPDVVETMDTAAPDTTADVEAETVDTATPDLFDAADSAPSEVSDATDVAEETADTAPEATDSTDVATTPPCAVITVAEGLLVAPPLTLHATASDSTGDVVTTRWTVVSTPSGFVEPLRPSRAATDVTLEASLAGSYVLQLEVFDRFGASACPPAEVTVQAVPTSAIHLELVWNDNTADPTLPIGADLDLHVFHPDAPGLDVDGDGAGDGWFDPVLDCAWHNPSPIWPTSDGAPNPAPNLLRRDDAGYGPEVIIITDPTPGLAYVAGFHVWDDEDTGYLQPTEIRIWIDGVLKNRPNFAVPVHAANLERVFTVEYPSGRLSFPFTTDGDFRPSTPTK